MTVWSLFYNSFLLQLLKKNEREKQQTNMIIITVVKEQTKMTTGSLHTKREVINEDMKKNWKPRKNAF